MATLSTEFDGSNDYVTLGTPAGMAGAPDDASVDKCFSFWFKTTNSAYGRWLISQAEDSTGQYKWGVQNLFGQLRIWCGGGLIDTTGTAYEDGAWHHIAVSVRTVSSVRTVQVWVDGVSEGTNTSTISRTFTASGTQSAQKAALFTASSAGTMNHVLSFTQRNLISGDTLAITFTITLG